MHWRAGADWLYAHLLDGDLASNHLSWQWVAGTGSSKPYLFNAENVARYATAPWHSDGSVIDQSYEALDAIARSHRTVPVVANGDGVDEPVPLYRPPWVGAARERVAADVAGRDVWLVHPWALGPPPRDLPAGCLRLGLLLSEFHDVWPWSPARWAFVGTRMAELAPLCLSGSRAEVALALADARSVQTLADPHIDTLLPSTVIRRPAPRLFAQVQRPCTSFSKWWTGTTRGIESLHELPGLAAWVGQGSAEPLFEQFLRTKDTEVGEQPRTEDPL